MAVKITEVGFEAINPKEVDFENMSDEQFYRDKLMQAFSLLPVIQRLQMLMNWEEQKIKKLQDNAPPIEVTSTANSASVRGPLIIDTTTVSSLQFSYLLMQFTYIEALCNVISESTIRQNKKVKVLGELEIDHLLERVGNFKKGKIDYRTSFVRLEDKIKDYTELFCKTNGKEYKLDKSVHWESFLLAKKLRDDITHPRNGVRSNVDYDVLYEMSVFVYWFTEEVAKLYIEFYDFPFYDRIEPYSYTCVRILNHLAGGAESRISKFKKKHEEMKDN